MKLGKHPHMSRIYKNMRFSDAADFISQKYKDRGKDRIEKRTYNFEMMELARLNDARRKAARRDVEGGTGKALEESYQNLELGLGGYYANGGPDYERGNIGLDPIAQDTISPRESTNVVTHQNLEGIYHPRPIANPSALERVMSTISPEYEEKFKGMNEARKKYNKVIEDTKMAGKPVRDFAGGGSLGKRKLEGGEELGIPRSENSFWEAQQMRQDLQPLQTLPSQVRSLTQTLPVVDPLPARGDQPGSLAFDLANLPATPTQSQSFISRDREKGFLGKVGDYFKEDVYAPGLAGTALNLGINAAMLAGGYDKTAPRYNPYEQDVTRLMQERGADFAALENQALAGYNVAASSAGQARSAALRNALVQGAASNLSRNLSQVKLQEQQYNDSVKAQLATTMNQLGAQRARADVVASELNQRSKANFQSQLSQFGAQLASTGKFFTRLRANKQMNEMYTSILSAKYQDFGVDKDLYNKVVKGQDLTEGEIFQLKNNPEADQLLQFSEWAKQNKTK